jgi:hypothetical protein
MYQVFTRTWWKKNPSWPNGLEPWCGPPRLIKANVSTEAEARAFAQEWNKTHKPGKYEKRAEFAKQLP